MEACFVIHISHNLHVVFSHFLCYCSLYIEIGFVFPTHMKSVLSVCVSDMKGWLWNHEKYCISYYQCHRTGCSHPILLPTLYTNSVRLRPWCFEDLYCWMVFQEFWAGGCKFLNLFCDQWVHPTIHHKCFISAACDILLSQLSFHILLS
jgi:hypothetical protein